MNAKCDFKRTMYYLVTPGLLMYMKHIMAWCDFLLHYIYMGQFTKLRLSCYLVLIAKPGNKTATVPWPDPYAYIYIYIPLSQHTTHEYNIYSYSFHGYKMLISINGWLTTFWYRDWADGWGWHYLLWMTMINLSYTFKTVAADSLAPSQQQLGEWSSFPGMCCSKNQRG